MYLVISSRYDPAARLLVEKWKKFRLLTCEDLAKPGNEFYFHSKKKSKIIADGKVISEIEVKGILTLIPTINEDELDFICNEDRKFVAAEMTADLPPKN